MSRLRILVVAVAGLALPVVLTLAVYVASARSLAATPAVVSVPSERIARPSEPAPVETTRRRDDDGGREDLSGNCDEAEHRLDPECRSGAGRDRSGSGRSGSSGSGSDDSSGRSGSDDSSGRSGSDDSSGRGRGRGRSSGSGSGDD